jgi:hypothetical protein
MTLPIGKLVPDILVEDMNGERRRLWDYRQKSHVILFRGHVTQAASFKSWKDEAGKRRERLEWLHAVLAIAPDEKETAEATIELIDRYGLLHKTLPIGTNSPAQIFDEIEKEYIYYEARHC